MADEKISELDAKVTIADTDLFVLMDEEAAPDQTKYITGANLKSQLLASLVDKIDKTHLSQDFGASAGRLYNLIVEPIAGEILRMLGCGKSPFSADINAAGAGGLTPTNVPYDGAANVNMFVGLQAYDGSAYWGQIILHNTTRSNSRKVVSVNIFANMITTTSSTDDWADNDVITTQSQINTQGGYIDVDVSAQVPATTSAIYIFAAFQDNENNVDNDRALFFHPFEAYDPGKRQWVSAKAALDSNTLTFPLKIISQRFTMLLYLGCVDVHVVLAVKAFSEYADT